MEKNFMDLSQISQAALLRVPMSEEKCMPPYQYVTESAPHTLQPEKNSHQTTNNVVKRNNKHTLVFV